MPRFTPTLETDPLYSPEPVPQPRPLTNSAPARAGTVPTSGGSLLQRSITAPVILQQIPQQALQVPSPQLLQLQQQQEQQQSPAYTLGSPPGADWAPGGSFRGGPLGAPLSQAAFAAGGASLAATTPQGLLLSQGARTAPLPGTTAFSMPLSAGCSVGGDSPAHANAAMASAAQPSGWVRAAWPAATGQAQQGAPLLTQQQVLQPGPQPAASQQLLAPQQAVSQLLLCDSVQQADVALRQQVLLPAPAAAGQPDPSSAIIRVLGGAPAEVGSPVGWAPGGGGAFISSCSQSPRVIMSSEAAPMMPLAASQLQPQPQVVYAQDVSGATAYMPLVHGGYVGGEQLALQQLLPQQLFPQQLPLLPQQLPWGHAAANVTSTPGADMGSGAAGRWAVYGSQHGGQQGALD